jgi:NADH:ubiquinone oxidoreductase subunit E
MNLPGTVYFLDEFHYTLDKIPVFTFTIQYHLKNRITSKSLRKEVKEIFKHYNDGEDISYSLQSFRIISNRNMYIKKYKISVVTNTGKVPSFFNFWN